MRCPSRFRTLFTVCALSAAVAACSDATSPTAADDLAPRRGRMLRPDQASMIKPGDFIVIRPEEYSKYGVPTFAAPSGGIQSLMAQERCVDQPYREVPSYQEYPSDGCNSDPCYDPWGNPTYNYGCNYPTPPACYDQWGSPTYAPGCSYPTPPACYDQWGSPTYAAGCTYPTAGPPTQQNYNSTAQYDGQVNSGGILLKQIRLISWSQGIQNVASFTVDAQFKNVGAAGGGCNGVAGAFDFATAYATGNGYIEVSRVAQWQGTIKWQVDGTHTFNPISGASGGGTFYTTSTFCG